MNWQERNKMSDSIWNTYKNFAFVYLGEGKQKQERIKSDKERTKVGASSSNQPSDPRYSPSMTSLHHSPENKKRRKAALKKSKDSPTQLGSKA